MYWVLFHTIPTQILQFFYPECLPALSIFWLVLLWSINCVGGPILEYIVVLDHEVQLSKYVTYV